MKKEGITQTVFAKLKVKNEAKNAKEATDFHYSDGNDTYRTEKWRSEISSILHAKGKTKEDIGRYIGKSKEHEYNNLVSKCPKQRETYLGIGLCLKQSEETINKWIINYAGKQALYVKSIEDLAWKYLIKLSCNSPYDDINYFQMHKNVCDVIHEEYESLCKLEYQKINSSSDNKTVYLNHAFDNSVNILEDDDKYKDLRAYVQTNIGSFDTAYENARKYLMERAVKIAELMKEYRPKVGEIEDERMFYNSPRNPKQPFNHFYIEYIINKSTRNFLCSKSNAEAIVNMRQHRKPHIKMCLSLGLTTTEIDEYLSLLGYEPLSAVLDDEFLLIHYLSIWEKNNIDVLYIRKQLGLINIQDLDETLCKLVTGMNNCTFDHSQMVNIISKNIFMRNTIKEQWKKDNGNKRVFPYEIHSNTQNNNFASKDFDFYK